MKRRLPTGIRNAHEPIMIGNAAVGFMPSRLTRIMHGRVEPDPERHQRAEQEVAGDGDDEQHAADAERLAAERQDAAAGQRLQLGDQHQRGRDQQRRAHPDLDLAASASCATTPAPSQAPSTAAAIIENSVSDVDRDELDV